MSVAGFQGQKELVIKIKADAKEAGKTFDDLKKQFKEQANLLRELSIAGLSSTDGFKRLTQEQKALGTVIQQLNREARGLSPALTASRYQLAEFLENVTTVTAGLYFLVKGLGDVTIASIKNGATLKVLRENYKGTAEDLELLKKATAGTLTEEQLIPIFNKATEQMKLTTNETARLLAYSEDLADKGIGSLTENFSSLTTAILTGGRGLRSLGIDQKQFKDDLKNTATQLGINTGLIQDGNEEDSISIEKLDAKTQRVLILKTLFDGGYIPSLENVISKEQDSADKLEAVQVKLKEAKTEAGLFILNGIEPLIDSFLGLEKGGNVAVGTITSISTATITALPLLAQLKIAFGAVGLSALGMGGFIAGAGIALAKLEDLINNFMPFSMTGRVDDAMKNYTDKQIKNAVDNAGQHVVVPDNPMDSIVNKAIETNKKKKELFDSRQVGNLSKGLNTGKDKKESEEQLLTLDKILSSINEQIKASESLFKLGDINAKQLDESYISAYKILQSNTALIDVTKKNISEEERLLEIQTNKVKFREKEVELQNKSFSNTAQEIKDRTFKKVLESGLNSKVIGNGGNPNAGIGLSEQRKLIEQFETSILDSQLNAPEKFNLIAEGINNMSNAVSTLFDNLASGNPDAFKSFLKSIVNAYLTSVQAMLFGAGSAAAAKGILSFGVSLITDLPAIAAAWLGLEAAKGIVQGLNTGGIVKGIGDTDSVPAMLTPGEVVIRKSAVNKYGADFFNSFNGGSNSINTLGRYANGGIVSGGGGLQIEIIGNAKLTGKGSELRAVLSKENIRVKQSRSKR